MSRIYMEIHFDDGTVKRNGFEWDGTIANVQSSWIFKRLVEHCFAMIQRKKEPSK